MNKIAHMRYALCLSVLLMLGGVVGCAASNTNTGASASSAEAPSVSSSAGTSASAGASASVASSSGISSFALESSEPAVTSASASGNRDLAAAFPSWNADSETLRTLIDFVAAATDEQSAGYIPPQDRVATFDLDGTLLCETAPVYANYSIMLHRVLDDPTYQADEESLNLCSAMREYAAAGQVDAILNPAKNEVFARAFAGMTPEQLRAYVVDFLNTHEAFGYSGMTYAESLYQPMVEVVRYLQDNDFDVYIVTACEREVARAVAETGLNVPLNHVVGSDLSTVATGQGQESPNAYTFTHDDQLLLAGEVLSDCGRTNKVIYIQREIGKRPVLAFGNSSGDFAMLNYAQANDAYPSMGVLVVADDAEREYGSLDKAAQMEAEAQARGWSVVSMRDDWSTIYGSSVVKTGFGAQGETAEDQSAVADLAEAA